MANISVLLLVAILLGMSAMKASTLDDSICRSLVETQGYACQEHTVTTEDGYILSMQRIPQGRSGNAATKPPVLIQHGLLLDAASWVVNPPDQSLPFVLADNGFDVWMANARGTKYSRGHTSISPTDPRYWEWSWDELAGYDLPATFQYVYDQTKQNLHYVGHSLGTLMALASLSVNNENVVSKLRSAALLSPIAYLGLMPSPTLHYAVAFSAQQWYRSGLREFAPGGPEVTRFMQNFCRLPGSNCSNLMSAVTGPNCCIDSETLVKFYEHEPQSTSVKNLVHIAQLVGKGSVTKFDYGAFENYRRYGSASPPVYDMTSIPRGVPLLMACGGRDLLSNPIDVRTLLSTLSGHDPDKLVVIETQEYAHADFILAANANQLVYTPVISFFDKY